MTRMTWRIALGAILCAGCAAGAVADGMPAAKRTAKPAAKAAPAPESTRPHVANWGGLYLGANVGYAWGGVDWQYVDPAGAAGHTSIDVDGAFLGGHFGIQHQWDRIVAGIEVSYGGGFVSKIDGRGPDTPAFAATFDARAQLNKVLTIGPRLGLATDRFLFYVTGGYAAASIVTADIVKATGLDNAASGNHHSGWFLGGGLEWALYDRWVAGLEYLHVALDTERHFELAPGFVGFGTTRDIDGDVDIIRFRLSYKLGRGDHAPSGAPLK